MEKPFKCCKIDSEGNITDMHIFLGRRIGHTGVRAAQEDLKAGGDSPLFDGAFGTSALREAARSHGVVNALSIHKDDSISDVRKKLCKVDPTATPQGVYMFTKVELPMTADAVYRKLSEKRSAGIKGSRFRSLVSDLGKTSDAQDIDPTRVYEYDAVLELDLARKAVWELTVALGVGFQAEYQCPANPWLAFADSPEDSFSRDGRLLMNSGNIVDNVIYYVDLTQLSAGKYNPIGYYPALLAKGISSASEYEKNYKQLEHGSKEQCSSASEERQYRDIDIIYSIAGSRAPAAAGTQDMGLKRGVITIHSPAPFTLPLDIVFKLLHTNGSRPLVKYNPGRRREKIYRLYADKESTNGRRIPYLPKSTIFRLTKVLASEKQVSVFIVEGDQPVILNFYSDSSMGIAFNLRLPLEQEALVAYLQEACNPVIDAVNVFMADRGYSLQRLNRLNDPFVQVNDVDVVLTDKLSSGMDIEHAASCMSAAFSLNSTTSEGVVNLTYTRVANFNKMDATESFITSQINSGLAETDILDALVARFGLEGREEARQKLLEFISQQQVVRDAFRSSRVKIRSNPGFKVMIVPEPFRGRISTTVEGINDYGYLGLLNTYVRALMLLAMNCPLPDVPKAVVAELCSVPAPSEQPDPKSKVEALNPGDTRAKEDLLNMLMSDTDSDTESESEVDQEEAHVIAEEPAMSRQAEGRTPEGDIDVSGMKLLNPNPFSLLLQEREPTLFRARKDETTYSYARACPSNNKRQPVILTSAEKQRIDKEHPGSYTKAISYKASPGSEEFFYICPRYWDLNRKTSLTQAEAQSGDYGGIIPQGARKAPEGSSIYEFDGNYHRDTAGAYRPLYPGFMRPKSHPGGKCIPCCFKTWDAPSRVKLRRECAGMDDKPSGDSPPAKFDDYVKGPEKWPLEKDRIGYLPPGLETFMQVSNRRCQISKGNTNIKPNTPCLLRLGCESSRNKSFLAAVSQLFPEVHGGATPTADGMATKILGALTLDIFSSLQNGALVPIFANRGDDREQFLPATYPSSVLARSIDMNDEAQKVAFEKIASAYEGFRNYLGDSDVVVDHRYLWDMLMQPNEQLFPAGLNLIILEESDADPTNDVRLLCPTNPYARKMFQVSRPTAVFFLRNHVYELLVIYEDRKTEYAVAKLFKPSPHNRGLLKGLVQHLVRIGDAIGQRCRPLPSLPRIYDYQNNRPASDVLDSLKTMNFAVQAKVFNFNGKIVGFRVQRGKRQGFIPCFPSTLMNDDLPIMWRDDVKAVSFQDTRSLLELVSKESKGAIISAPTAKVVEDGLIVGVLTEANQFVQIDPPEQDTYGDDLRVMTSGNPFEADETVLTSDATDRSRVMTMQRIRLETMFFNAFRNLIREMLTSFGNAQTREKLVQLLDSKEKTYHAKLEDVANLLQLLLNDRVRFAEMGDEFIEQIVGQDGRYDITLCSAGQEDCVMVVPKTNLINQMDNENAYFVRVADEFIRYARIRRFLLSPDTFLSFNDVKYELNKDEIILLQSLLNQSYFEGLVPRDSNPYVIGSSYDMAEPANTEVYTDKAQLGAREQVELVEEESEPSPCQQPTIVKVTGKWVKIFPSGTEELVFSNQPEECTFQVVVAIANRNPMSGRQLALRNVKLALAAQYKLLWEEYGTKVLAVLSSEGKRELAKRVASGATTIDSEIAAATYTCSNLDLWLLAIHFKLPIVLYTSTKLGSSGLPIQPLYARAEQQEFYFLKVPGPRSVGGPKFRLAIHGRSATVRLSTLREGMSDTLTSALKEDTDNVKDYLARFKGKKLKIVTKFSEKGKVNLK